MSHPYQDSMMSTPPVRPAESTDLFDRVKEEYDNSESIIFDALEWFVNEADVYCFPKIVEQLVAAFKEDGSYNSYLGQREVAAQS